MNDHNHSGFQIPSLKYYFKDRDDVITLGIDEMYYASPQLNYERIFRLLEEREYSVSKIILDFSAEHEVPTKNKHIDVTADVERLSNIIDDTGIELYVLLCRFDEPPQDTKDMFPVSTKFICLPTADLSYEMSAVNSLFGDRSIPTLFKHDYTSDINRLFVSLNYKPRSHRIIFADRIRNKGILNHGYFSFNADGGNSMGNLMVDNFGKTVELETGYELLNSAEPMIADRIIGYPDIVKLPIQFYHGLFNIVTETEYKESVITEKVWQCVLRKKPFIILGGVNNNERLRELGLKTFENVFDYSFDQKEDLIERIDMLIETLEKMVDIDYKETYEKCKEILDYNYLRAVEIYHKNEYIPKDVSKFIYNVI
jgi:hypothetical protein